MNQFVVIGAGRFGIAVAVTLSQKGYQVLLLDEDEQIIQQMSEVVTHAVQIDVTDEKAMQSLDLGEMDVAVIAIGSNLEASILATMQLKELGVKTVVAKASTLADKKILSRVGADRIIFPEREMGVRVANSLVSPSISDYIELSPGFNMVEISVPPGLQGQTLSDANVRSRFGVDIVAIKRRKPELDKEGESGLKEDIIIAPPASEVLGKNDSLLVVGKEKNIKKFKSF